MSDDNNIEGLRRNRDKILGEKRALAEENQRLQARIAELEAPPPDAARAAFIRENAQRLQSFENGSPEWLAEFTKIEAEMQPLIAAEVESTRAPLMARAKSLREQITKLTAHNAASALASKLSRPGSASVLLPFIRERINVEMGDDETPTVKFRAADGSETTAEGVEQELLRDASVAPIIQDAKAFAARSAEEHARRVAETLGRKP